MGFYISIRPAKFISKITPDQLGLEYENISFDTSDGLTLQGWFIPYQPDQQAAATSKATQQNKQVKTIILLHGYPADKGDILPSHKFLAQHYNLLLFDFRYLGASQGKYSTAGALEVKDLLGAIDYLKARDINIVGIYGFSVGGAVALMAAPKLPEIKVIVSNSSYADLSDLVPVIFRPKLIQAPLTWLTNIWAKLLIGVDIKDVSPATAARNLKIPVLIIHAKQDQVIPFAQALKLQTALQHNVQAEYLFFEGLHGESDLNYQQRILVFFETNL